MLQKKWEVCCQIRFESLWFSAFISLGHDSILYYGVIWRMPQTKYILSIDIYYSYHILTFLLYMNQIYKPSHPILTQSFLCQNVKSLSFAVSFTIVEEDCKVSRFHHPPRFSFQKSTRWIWSVDNYYFFDPCSFSCNGMFSVV